MDKMILKVNVIDLQFKFHLSVSHDACADLGIPTQICDELSCDQGKVYERTYRRTGTGNDNTHSSWKAKG